MKRLRDVNVRSFQTLAFQRHVDDRVKADIRQVTKLLQYRTLDSNGFFLEPVQRDKGRTIRRFGEYLIRCNPRPIKADVGQRSERLNHQRATTFYDLLIVQFLHSDGHDSRGFTKVRGTESPLRPSYSLQVLSGSFLDWFAHRYVGRVGYFETMPNL